MSLEELKAHARRVPEELLTQGDLAVADAVFAPDVVYHDPTCHAPGVAGTKQVVLALRRAFPDLCAVVEDEIAEGDRVVQRLTLSGTHRGAYCGLHADRPARHLAPGDHPAHRRGRDDRGALVQPGPLRPPAPARRAVGRGYGVGAGRGRGEDRMNATRMHPAPRGPTRHQGAPGERRTSIVVSESTDGTPGGRNRDSAGMVTTSDNLKGDSPWKEQRWPTGSRRKSRVYA